MLSSSVSRSARIEALRVEALSSASSPSTAPRVSVLIVSGCSGLRSTAQHLEMPDAHQVHGVGGLALAEQPLSAAQRHVALRAPRPARASAPGRSAKTGTLRRNSATVCGSTIACSPVGLRQAGQLGMRAAARPRVRSTASSGRRLLGLRAEAALTRSARHASAPNTKHPHAADQPWSNRVSACSRAECSIAASSPAGSPFGIDAARAVADDRDQDRHSERRAELSRDRVQRRRDREARPGHGLHRGAAQRRERQARADARGSPSRAATRRGSRARGRAAWRSRATPAAQISAPGTATARWPTASDGAARRPGDRDRDEAAPASERGPP